MRNQRYIILYWAINNRMRIITIKFLKSILITTYYLVLFNLIKY